MLKSFKIIFLSLLFAFSSNNNSSAQFIINPYVYSSCDSDAQAFITAAGITDATQKLAICQLVSDLKTYSLWTKFYAIYPFVGGTATTHKYNLKDPQDTDGAYRLAFAGGWTHSSTGAAPNGTTGYANTFFVPDNVPGLGLNSAHISYYSRTNVSEAAIDMGARDGGGRLEMIIRYTGDDAYYAANDNNLTPLGSQTDSRGFFISNRTVSTTLTAFRNTTKIVDQAQTSTAKQGYPIFLGATDNGIAISFSTKECAFSTIGTGLSDADVSNFYAAVQAFQTSLGRQL